MKILIFVWLLFFTSVYITKADDEPVQGEAETTSAIVTTQDNSSESENGSPGNDSTPVLAGNVATTPPVTPGGSNTTATTPPVNGGSNTTATTPPVNGGSNTTATTPPLNGGNTPQTPEERFVDVSGFSKSMDGWDFRGDWTKHNFSDYDDRLVKDYENSEDHIFLVNKVTPIKSVLRKTFPPIVNGTISMTSLTTFTDIFIQGMTVDAVGNKTVVFLSGDKERWKERNNYWITEEFKIADHNNSFEIIFRANTSTSAIWAIDVITVEGIGNGSHSKNHSGVPPAIIPPDNKPQTTPPQEGENSGSNGNAQEMSSIASSMWQAIYVFIALFIVVLVLFVWLIVKQKRKLLYWLHKTP